MTQVVEQFEHTMNVIAWMLVLFISFSCLILLIWVERISHDTRVNRKETKKANDRLDALIASLRRYGYEDEAQQMEAAGREQEGYVPEPIHTPELPRGSVSVADGPMPNNDALAAMGWVDTPADKPEIHHDDRTRIVDRGQHTPDQGPQGNEDSVQQHSGTVDRTERWYGKTLVPASDPQSPRRR
jgi:hypothetical protein